MRLNVFIALNKITLTAINKILQKESNCIVFYHSKRCNSDEIKGAKLKLPLNFITEYILYFFLKLFGKKINLHLPHFKVGRRVGEIINNGYPISLIPDGMDYYRVIPSNIDVKNKKLNIKKIYLDNYHKYIPEWILSCPILVNLNLSWCECTSVALIKFEMGTHIIIESPGIEKLYNETHNFPDGLRKIYIVRHPALGKRNILPNLKNIDFTEIKLENLEKTLSNLCGVNAYFGETFTLVMLLNTKFFKFNNVKIFLERERVNILKPLISLLNETNAEIIYY